eukprot:scaffold334_cov241-Pinguiococcus_pyrenoidosus.AAC.18
MALEQPLKRKNVARDPRAEAKRGAAYLSSTPSWVIQNPLQGSCRQFKPGRVRARPGKARRSARSRQLGQRPKRIRRAISPAFSP